MEDARGKKEMGKNGKIAVVSAIVAFSIIAMAQTAVSQPTAVVVKGIVTYAENGTSVPDGWTVSISVDDKNYTEYGEPWNGTTSFYPPIWDYRITASANANDVVRATVNSPDMVYTGTNTAISPGGGTMYINVTVAADRTKPIVINASANPSTIAMNTGFTELRVDVADRDSRIANVTINLSSIGGNACTFMANIGNYSQGGLIWTMYNYTTNSSVEGTFDLTVNATDIYGNYNDTVSITLNVTPAIQYNITIRNGWNLISIPIEPLNKTLSNTIIGAVNSDTIYRWVTGAGYKSAEYYAGTWYGDVSDVEPIEPEVGYWFDRKGSDYNLTITGVPLTGTIIETPIYTGWNVVGYASLTETNLSVINDPVNGDTIYRWIPGAGYKSAEYYAGTWYGDVSDVEPIEPGVGYWFDRKGPDYTWTYPA